ncbi:AAA family ATPase [Allohahella sp. A8]|uniref:AAA family ATPase n=1 Tax=Allohahella sp. A8 TaxID=3141461 RepID=UPI000C095961|nr:AAA family ATPase [Hahellaceae bacterium]|tara:strand:+ start:67062 stop:67994 length:933 start_codon:yes stop_codon:yes gene_type:complete
MSLKALQTALGNLRQTQLNIETVILGKSEQITMALCCLLCKGHLLIEDIPGMGKTTLSHALANALGLSYNRIQFTSDLLPADLLGLNLFDKNSNEFVFHPGPLFAQLVLADEINRATPKAQSALLEAMEERQISIEGTTHPLPKPFFVIATQNPSDQSGTYLLPESQMDRFFMRIHLGFPPPKAERELLQGVDRRAMVQAMESMLSPDTLTVLQDAVERIHTSDALLDYVQRIIAFTRSGSKMGNGLSPRGAIALVRAAKAWALMHERDFALPDDVQAVLPAVIEHRLGSSSRASHHPLSEQILQQVPAL